MRKLYVLTAACAAVCAALFAAGCAPGREPSVSVRLLRSDREAVVVEVAEGDEGKSLYDALVLLREDGALTFGGSESEFGVYVTSVYGVEALECAYWAVYTSLGTLDGVVYSDPSYGTWAYEGRELSSASYGVSGLPLADGALFALVYTSLE